nr:MAG TPA: hypothetical protein [Caudoviricetes sp.]
MVQWHQIQRDFLYVFGRCATFVDKYIFGGI